MKRNIYVLIYQMKSKGIKHNPSSNVLKEIKCPQQQIKTNKFDTYLL